MKRCPTCNHTYEDAQQFCLEDGSPLVSGTGGFDAQATMVSAPPNISAPTPTPRAESGNWPQNPSWPTPGASQAAQPPRKKKLWPWILAILAALVIGIIVVVGVVAYVAYNSSGGTNANTNLKVNSNTNTKTNTSRNTNDNSNANTSTNQNANTNDNANENTNPDENSNLGLRPGTTNSNEAEESAPTNSVTVLDQLKGIEDDWAEANVKADKAALDNILAEEFVGTAGDGTVEKKAQYITNIKPDSTIKSQTFEGLDVSLHENTAILTGINVVKFSNGATQRYRFTDTFVWRDGRWQAISSQASRVK